MRIVFTCLLIFVIRLNDNAQGIPPLSTQKDDNDTETYTIVEEMPAYPGGQSALVAYLSENIKYPIEARAAGVTGTVFITFHIGKDGKVANVKVLRGIGGGCDEEAVRVVSSMPAWRPGYQKGKAVIVQYNLPIKFSLNNRKDE
jgi:TonB family protein